MNRIKVVPGSDLRVGEVVEIDGQRWIVCTREHHTGKITLSPLGQSLAYDENGKEVAWLIEYESRDSPLLIASAIEGFRSGDSSRRPNAAPASGNSKDASGAAHGRR